MAALSFHLESLDDPEPWFVEQELFDILNECLQPSSTTTPTAAAQGIDALTPMKRPDPGGGKKKESLESFLWEIWGMFIEIAKQIPHDHPSQDRLVKVIIALRELPPTSVEIWTVGFSHWLSWKVGILTLIFLYSLKSGFGQTCQFWVLL